MVFAAPWFLAALAVVPLLGAWLWRQKQARLRRWQVLRVEQWLPRKIGRQWPLLAALCGLLLALAQPQWGQTAQTVDMPGLQIMVLLDLSQSMLVEDVNGRRLAAAHRAINTVATQLESGDELGIIGFAGEHRLLLPLTPAYETLLPSVLSAAQPSLLSVQGSALTPALQTAVQTFPQPHTAQPILLILTDGELHERQAVATARRLEEQNILLVVVGIGTEAGGAVPNVDENGRQAGFKQDAAGETHISRLQTAVLEQLTAAGSGRYLPPTAVSNLPAILANLRQTHSGQRQIVQPVARYHLFLLIALLLLLWHYMRPKRLPTFRLQPRPRWSVWLLLLLVGCSRDPSEVALQQGNVAYESGDYAAAVALYEDGLGGSETAVLSYNAANAHYRLGAYEQAVRIVQDFQPGNNVSMIDKVYFTLGNSHFQQGDYEEAIAAYQQVLRHTPDDADAKHNLELALLMRVSSPETSSDEENGAQQNDEQTERPSLPTPGGEQQFNPDAGTPLRAQPVLDPNAPEVALPSLLQEAVTNAPLLMPQFPDAGETAAPAYPDW